MEMAKTSTKTKDSTTDADLATLQKGIPGLRTGRNFTPITFLKSGFDDFDKEFLGGGVASGKLTQLWGGPGAGKSTMARRYAAMAQKQEPDKYVLYYNPEFDLDEAQLTQAGIDVDSKFLFVQDNNITQAAETMTNILKTLPISAIFLDSVGAMVADDKRLGSHSRAVKAFINELVKYVFEKQAWCVFTNQVTMNIGGYGNPEMYPGGKAYEHAVQVSMKLGKVQWLPDNEAEEKTGLKVRVTVDKHKLKGVHKTDDNSHLNFFFENGIEKATALDVYNSAVNAGLIKVSTSGSKLFNPEGEEIRKSRKKAGIMNDFLSDDSLRKEVQSYVARVPSTGVSFETFDESEDDQLPDEAED